MLPTVMMGSFIGVIMNAAMPDLVLQICLTLLLGFLTVQSLLKAREILKKENLKAKEQRAAKKEAMKAKRMLTDEGDDEPTKNQRVNVRSSNIDTDSGDEGFSSEEESFRTSLEIVDKKLNQSENIGATMLSSSVDNITTTTEMH